MIVVRHSQIITPRGGSSLKQSTLMKYEVTKIYELMEQSDTLTLAQTDYNYYTVKKVSFRMMH